MIGYCTYSECLFQRGFEAEADQKAYSALLKKVNYGAAPHF
jgi:hypothetical protein